MVRHVQTGPNPLLTQKPSAFTLSIRPIPCPLVDSEKKKGESRWVLTRTSDGIILSGDNNRTGGEWEG